MPRTARASVGGVCYHALNRGNARAEVFRKEADYDAFLDLMLEAGEHVRMRVLDFSLLPNHFHMTLWPYEDGDLGRWMHWLLTSHAVRYHSHYAEIGMGHIWQGRFKAFPIETDEHLLRVFRYIERNPVRAGLVARAEEWRWSGLSVRLKPLGAALLTPWPLPCPTNWPDLLSEPEASQDLNALRRCVNRGTPYGSDAWVTRTADALGLNCTLRPRGRPASRHLRPPPQ